MFHFISNVISITYNPSIILLTFPFQSVSEMPRFTKTDKIVLENF